MKATMTTDRFVCDNWDESEVKRKPPSSEAVGLTEGNAAPH